MRPECRMLSGLGDMSDDADDVMQLDRIACVEAARDGLLPHARDSDLPFRILGLDVIDVEGHLAVDADRLHLPHDRRLRSLEHSASIDPSVRSASVLAS